MLVVTAGLADGRKVVVAVTPGHRESVESWSEVLRDLRDRGMNPPTLVIADGHLGIWGALRNVWPVESPFAALRLQTDAARRFKKVERATAVIWKMLMVAQTRFRRLNAAELLAKVYAGMRYEDGIEVAGKEAAA